MVRNHALARAISDASWRELRSMLEYKCAWVRHEALSDRAEVGDLRRVAVAAVA
jgi:transposase